MCITKNHEEGCPEEVSCFMDDVSEEIFEIPTICKPKRGFTPVRRQIVSNQPQQLVKHCHAKLEEQYANGWRSLDADEIKSTSYSEDSDFGAGDQYGNPTWEDRSLLVVINMARISPSEFAVKFIEPEGHYSQDIMKPPLYQKSYLPLTYSRMLNYMARWHSTDMAINGCFLYEDCNGGLRENRKERFYKQCGRETAGWSEVIGGNPINPFTIVATWLCGAWLNGATCLSDYDHNSYHRRILLNKANKVAGCGAVQDITGAMLYTVDLLDVICNTTSFPIHSASHLISHGNIRYILTYWGVQYLLSANVYIEENGIFQEKNMSLLMGVRNEGVYHYSPVYPFVPCVRYFFKVIAVNRNLYRYPARGFLVVHTVAHNCTKYPFVWTPSV
eukprot:gene16873-20063_t